MQQTRATFDESVRPGGREERFNQALWLTLLQTAKQVADEGTLVVATDGYEIEDSRWTKHLSDLDLDDLAGSVDRLLARAERYGLLSTEETTIAAESDGADGVTPPASLEEIDPTPGRPAIRYSVVKDPMYPDRSVGTHAAPSPFEEGFLKIARALAEVRENLSAAGVDGLGFEQPLNRTAALVERVTTRTDRQAPPRSEVRSALRQADRLIPQMLVAGTKAVVSEWAKHLGFDVVALGTQDEKTDAATPAEPATPAAETTPVAPPSLSEFEPLRPLLEEDADRAMLISAAEAENQVLVLIMPPPERTRAIQAAYEGAAAGEKGQQRRAQRLPVVEIRQQPPDTPVDLPQEVLTVTETDPNVGWAASMMWWRSQTRTIEKTVDLAGWNVFPLNQTGDNVGELRALLDNIQFVAVGSEASS